MKNTLTSLIAVSSLFLASCTDKKSEPQYTEYKQEGSKTWTDFDIINSPVPINLPQESLSFKYDIRYAYDFDKDGKVDAITDSPYAHSRASTVFIAIGYQEIANERGFNLGPKTKVMSTEFRENLNKIITANHEMARDYLSKGERYFPTQTNLTGIAE